jgi:hypothetical protein
LAVDEQLGTDTRLKAPVIATSPVADGAAAFQEGLSK